MRLLGLIFAITCFSSCYKMSSDEDLRTVPVTNNPTIVPNRGGSLPFPAI